MLARGCVATWPSKSSRRTLTVARIAGDRLAATDDHAAISCRHSDRPGATSFHLPLLVCWPSRHSTFVRPAASSALRITSRRESNESWSVVPSVEASTDPAIVACQRARAYDAVATPRPPPPVEYSPESASVH